jgi:hypothetical protein
MTSEIKKKGRPPKNGVATPERLQRSMMIIHAYQKARARGEKHSVAVREAVDFVRQLVPETPISETEVRRVLSEFQPQHSPIALKVACSILEGEEAAKIRNRFAQMLELSGTKSPMEMGDQDQRRCLCRFRFGFHKRPIYPRYNAKTPNP